MKQLLSFTLLLISLTGLSQVSVTFANRSDSTIEIELTRADIAATFKLGPKEEITKTIRSIHSSEGFRLTHESITVEAVQGEKDEEFKTGDFIMYFGYSNRRKGWGAFLKAKVKEE
jgi:hypothetical protein